VRSTLTSFVGGVERGRQAAAQEATAGRSPADPYEDPHPGQDSGAGRSADEVRSTLTAFVAGVDRGRREAVETHPDDALAATGASSGTPSSEEGEG
jgi:hypothetical protein